MDKIPFKLIGACSALLTLLIVLRCAMTVVRVLYYGGSHWLSAIQADPWLYVSVASAAISVVCFAMAVIRQRWQEPLEEEEEDQEDEA